METKKIILKLRTERGMSQDELANKVMVTRQAASRWENVTIEQGIEMAREIIDSGKALKQLETFIQLTNA